jgi:peptide/nickel transport system ATP-binding protein
MSAPLLEVRGLSHSFRTRGTRAQVRALDGVDLTVSAGEIVGLVGESGSGKSTLARAIVGLLRPDAGSVALEGVAAGRSADDAARARRLVQIVFQDPYLSLNPRLSIGTTVAEPLTAPGIQSGARRSRAPRRRARVAELLEAVGLPSTVALQRPGELSGGARQRVAIARALAIRPRLVVLDEPISSLDPSIGAQVMALLRELHTREGLAFLLISHDLATVRGIAQRVAVMDAGRIVEEGPAERVLSSPTSARGRALVGAAHDLSPPPWAWPGSTAQA